MVVNSSRMNFKEAIDEYLKVYRDDVWYELTKSINEVAREAAKKLRTESRAEFTPTGKHPGKEYYKGWTVKQENGRIRVGATVYGKSGTYQLAHLLEYGHVTRNGTGRKFSDTPAHEHIKKVSDWAITEAIDRTITNIERLNR